MKISKQVRKGSPLLSPQHCFEHLVKRWLFTGGLAAIYN